MEVPLNTAVFTEIRHQYLYNCPHESTSIRVLEINSPLKSVKSPRQDQSGDDLTRTPVHKTLTRHSNCPYESQNKRTAPPSIGP